MSSIDEIAQNALEAYDGDEYETCGAALGTLVNGNAGVKVKNLAILLNHALLTYRRSGFCGTNEYKDSLQRLATEYGIQIPGIQTRSTASQRPLELTAGYLIYNCALLHYHAAQHRTASRILQALLDSLIHAPDRARWKSLLIEVCFLLLEMSLLMGHGGKALEYIMALEETCELKADARQASPDSGARDSHAYRLLQAKIRCSLLCSNTKSCKKETKLLSGFDNAQRQSFKQVFYKGCLELQRENYRKAVKFVATADAETEGLSDMGDCIPAISENALGCVYGRLRKHHLALFYFENAVAAHRQAHEQATQKPVYTIATPERAALLHNVGVALLQCRQPRAAFETLLLVTQTFSCNPRLWLRLAECCMQIYKPSNDVDFQPATHMDEMINRTIGIGPHRKLIVNFAPDKTAAGINPSAVQSSGGIRPTEPTLQFAAQCLKNALHLLAGDRIEPDGVSLLSASPGVMLTGVECTRLKCSVLCAAAYVHLCLGDYLTALDFAKRLLAQSDTHSVHRFLGNLYAGEALIRLNLIDEALQHITLENIPEINLTDILPPSTLQPGDSADAVVRENREVDWQPDNRQVIRQTIMLYNVGLAYALKGDYASALQCCRNVEHGAKTAEPVTPVQVHMLALYSTLQLGEVEGAWTLLRQHLPYLRPIPG